MRAFTLLELLISIFIIMVIAVLAVPNIKKFGLDQQLEDSASNVISALQQAQSGAVSGIRCSSGAASTQWNTNLTGTTYNLVISCQGGSTDTRIPSTQFSQNPSNVIQMVTPSSCGDALIQNVYFASSVPQAACVGGGSSSSNVYFILKNTNNDKCVKITVGSGGVVNKEAEVCP